MTDAEKLLMLDFMDHVLKVLHTIADGTGRLHQDCYFQNRRTSAARCFYSKTTHSRQDAEHLEEKQRHDKWLDAKILNTRDKGACP